MISGFTYADIVASVLALVLLIIGYKKGFIVQLFVLLKFAGAIVVAVLLYKLVGGWIAPLLSGTIANWISFLDPEVAAASANTTCDVIAFILILIVASIIISIIGNALKKATNNKIVGDLDKVFGLVYSVGLLYIIILGVDFGIDYLLQLEAVTGIEFVKNLLVTLQEQFSQGVVLGTITQANWVGNIISTFISAPAA